MTGEVLIRTGTVGDRAKLQGECYEVVQVCAQETQVDDTSIFYSNLAQF